MQDQDKILSFLKATGPTLPIKVAKNISTDTILASAHLSDLYSRGKIKMSNLKVGGSSLYYLEGQEAELYQFAADNLNPKNYAVIEKLRQEKIFREAKLDLLSKVALRSLKDFAIPLRVKFEGQEEIFWRWYLLSPEEAKDIITDMLYGASEEQVGPEPEAILEVQKEILPAVEKLPEAVSAAKESKEHKEPPIPVMPESIPLPEAPAALEPQDNQVQLELPAKAVPQLEAKHVVKEVKTEPDHKEVKETKPVHTKTTKKRNKTVDKLLPLVEDFFEKLNVKVKSKEMVRKDAEHNFIIEVPGSMGSITYFCKAKSKIRCDEKDLSIAYMEAQIKKLPLLFLYSKSVTKKALEMLETDAFQNANVKKIE